MDIPKRGRERRLKFSSQKEDIESVDNTDNNFNWDFIRELEDDDETNFYEEINRLTTEGALAFKSIKQLYAEHPYALDNSERLKKDIEKIEVILQDIEKIFEP